MAFGELSLTDLFPFGKHKGDQVEDVIYDDPNYLTWCVQEEVFDFDDNAKKSMEERKII